MIHKQAAQQTPKQRLALAICDFLTTSTTDGTLTAEDKDSIDVAVNCIAESFKVDPSDDAAVKAAIGPQKLLDVFGVYEKLQAKDKAASTPAPAAAASSSSSSSVPEPSEAQKKEAESLKSKGNAAMAQK